MDRSFLSDKQVVAASRDFVCARLISFEDGEEAKLMQRLWGSAQVNTVFALLDPAGARTLSRVGRTPRGPFADAAALAAEMRAITKQFPARKGADGKLALPLLEDVRVALNVTECDAQQLVVLRGDAKKLAKLERALTALAWSEPFVGRFLYARGDDETDWSVIDGVDKAPAGGLLIIRSERFGLTGKVIASLPASARGEQLEKAMRDAVASHQPKPVDTRQVRRDGRRSGVRWQAELPDKR
jgi:hypothetical protein